MPPPLIVMFLLFTVAAGMRDARLFVGAAVRPAHLWGCVGVVTGHSAVNSHHSAAAGPGLIVD